ncbi:MAG: protoporphyrinogen oxidase [Acidobacteriales bacterium]|nr:protoporphyrinogen oxidase [Terriglobales bacterium]
MSRTAIIGGGISGLSAAYYLAKADAEVTLFEASARVGGVIRTERVGDFLVECGPDSFVSAKPWAAELARELGLGDALIGSNDHLRKTHILVSGRMLEMPGGLQLMVPTDPWAMLATPLFSWATKWRMAREFLFPPEPLPEGKDESVADFTRRHFGQEAVERLADPLLGGVFGGDSSAMSARAVLANFVALEKSHRSLARGLRKMKRPGGGAIFTTFRNGLQQFIDAIAAALPPGSVRLYREVRSVARGNGGWIVRTDRDEAFDHVVLALPTHHSARLLWELDPALAAQLNKIRYNSSCTVALIDVPLEGLPAGFGFLVPRAEQKQILACTYVHNKFSGRAPEGHGLLRVFLTRGFDRPDAEVASAVVEELSAILGVAIKPKSTHVARWPQAMAQYEVGHLDRVAQIDALAARHRGLHLIGNALRGIGIPDCVREAKAVAERIAEKNKT